VLRVIESHIESLIEARWKILQRRIVAADISVADVAHRYRGCCELAAMAIGAGLVTREARRCRVIGSLVTGIAGEGTVSLTGVKEF
jgi:hypothetical protein